MLPSQHNRKKQTPRDEHPCFSRRPSRLIESVSNRTLCQQRPLKVAARFPRAKDFQRESRLFQTWRALVSDEPFQHAAGIRRLEGEKKNTQKTKQTFHQETEPERTTKKKK